ncbi:MAG: diacylglycerol/lipid kinase family protein [Sphingomicrobium sp.]
MSRTRVLINRDGGAASADLELAAHVKSALGAAGIDGDVHMLDGSAIAKQCREAVEASEPLVVVGGGDGTLSSAAAELSGSGTRLGILPLGTLNHFARDLGIPTDLEAAALVIGAGREQRVDVAEMNGRVFINNSAVGLYPLLVRDREVQQRRLGRGKRLAMTVAAIRTLARFHHQRLALTVNDEASRVDTPLLFVGNNDYRLELPFAGQRATLADGRLCVLVLRSKSRAGFVAAVVRALVGRSREDDIVRVDDVGSLRVDTARGHLTVSLDGEVERVSPPLRYSIRKGALRVVTP